jgi:CBS domain-containing protein
MVKDEPPHEKHPILTHQELRADGSRTIHFRVFCRRQARSFTLEACLACAQSIDVEGAGSEACLRCKPEHQPPPSTDGPPTPTRVGEDVPVGTLLSASILCVHQDLDVVSLTSLFVERGLPSVFVVDDGGRLVGIVAEGSLVPPRPPSDPPGSFPPPPPSSGRLSTWPDGTLTRDVMATVSAVREDTSVRHALLEMAVTHVRQMPIVTPSGEPLGLLCDLDGMRWLSARARTAR